MSFPRSNTIKTCFIICGTNGLKSAKRDGYALADKFIRLGFNSNVIIDNVADEKWISDKIESTDFTTTNGEITFSIYNTLDIISSFLSTLSGVEEKHDVIITISAHGYGGKNSNYFSFGGKTINRKIMRSWFKGLEQSQHKIIILIDTCHGQNMVGFEKQGYQGNQSEIVISGCSANQSMMEDISSKYGYGGGFICAFLDSIDSKKVNFNVKDTIDSCKARVKMLGATLTVYSAE
jgi:hypothetical protein